MEGTWTSEMQIVALKLLLDAKDLDELLVKWASSLAERFKFISSSLESSDNGSEHVYPPRIDVYFDRAKASLWNSWRAQRLLVHATVVNCAELLENHCNSYAYRSERTGAMNRIQSLADDICSSIPFFLGHEAHYESRYPHEAGAASLPLCFGENSIAHASLMRPSLSVASQIVYVPYSQRQWMQQYLTVFASHLGNREKALRLELA